MAESDPPQIEVLFREVVARAVEDRAEFLASACKGDEVLRTRIEQMLALSEEGGEMLDMAEVAESAVGPLASGQTLGKRYHIGELLGRGGIGEVWRAYDLRLCVNVALKRLLKPSVGDAHALAMLRREVRSARQVVSPNVCRIYDLEEIDGQELVSMEYVDGTTLIELLRSRGPLSLRETMEIAPQFLAGLEAIHDAGLIHRDIKPDNVMITRSGRVVLMDFGLAKPQTDQHTATIAGTPAYMPPEQIRGGQLDPRTDIFAAGVVLAEMINDEGLGDSDVRKRLHHGVHQDPPQLPDSRWRPVLLRALAKDPADRYPTARALGRALEKATLRVEGAEELHPYPGLACFTEADAEYFFGRELEVEALWKRLQRPHLLAVIGPSGAGKSSFLRAGLIPAMPEGWRAVVCHPGDAPMSALAQSLVDEFAGDTDALRGLVWFNDPDVAVQTFSNWRKRHREALLIVDQFEELFTLNSKDDQARFTDVLSRLALEAGVHVLLSMRDDFLFHCHDYPVLAPIFSELTPLGPPAGAALRRAIVQPALLCGYRVEDDALVEEMLDDVARERGALPLLAFGLARLWEHRDRDRGLLTRQAYEKIGGVEGALAQHAEATVDRIGDTRLPIVRELFRNLVTAQGTRASREVSDLLSVFDEPESAEHVLRQLVHARLLTSFEQETAQGDEAEPTRRVEIIHESLLTAWPRLVRWRTQDADRAQLRDQVRQAAKLWQERGKPADLLWTGTSFKEFQLWRSADPGGLTTAEEAFSRAMSVHAERRRARRRLAGTAVLTVLLLVTATIAYLWRDAVAAARRSDAANLFALGQLQENRTEALAYLLASLEHADNSETRRLILENLWKGPTEFRLAPAYSYYSIDFSLDGRWLAVENEWSESELEEQKGGMLLASDGGPPTKLQGSGWGMQVRIGSNSDVVAQTIDTERQRIGIWSIPEGRLLRELSFDGTTSFDFSRDGQRLFTYTESGAGEDKEQTVQSWAIGGGEPEFICRVRGQNRFRDCAVDPTGTRFAWTDGQDVFVAPLGGDPDRLEPSAPLQHDDVPRGLAFDSSGELLVTSDSSVVKIWSLTEDHPRLVGTRPGSSVGWGPRFNESGSLLADVGQLIRLNAPPDARSIPAGAGYATAFHPNGSWLATGTPDESHVSLWPLSRQLPVFLARFPDHGSVYGLAFTPDGSRIVSAGGKSVRIWPLEPDRGERSKILHAIEEPHNLPTRIMADPNGKFVVICSLLGNVRVLPLDGGPVRELEGFTDTVWALAVGPSGRLVAAGSGNYKPEEAVIRVWDLETGDVQILDPADGKLTDALEFTPEGDLLASSVGTMRLWNLDDGTHEVLADISVSAALHWTGAPFDLGPDGRRLLAVSKGRLSIHELATGTSQELSSHGTQVVTAIFDQTGEIVVSTDREAAIRVGPVSGEEPHLLLGQSANIGSVAVSPDRRWIATGSTLTGTIVLWPMPDVASTPLHRLPRQELIAKLKTLTNLRVVRDESVASGWKLEIDPFPGWETVPTW